MLTLRILFLFGYIFLRALDIMAENWLTIWEKCHFIAYFPEWMFIVHK